MTRQCFLRVATGPAALALMLAACGGGAKDVGQRVTFDVA